MNCGLQGAAGYFLLKNKKIHCIDFNKKIIKKICLDKQKCVDFIKGM